MQQDGLLSGIAIVLLGLANAGNAYAGSVADPAQEAGTEAKLEDPCDLAFDAVYLKSSRLSKGIFFGIFRVQPDRLPLNTEDFVFEGRRDGNGFHVEEPTVSFEFRDPNGQWGQLLIPPGTYDAPPDKLAMRRSADVELVIQLPARDVATLAPEWRVALRSIGNRACVRSTPFRVLQSRGPLKGFVSKSIPKPATTTAHTLRCPCDGQSRQETASETKN